MDAITYPCPSKRAHVFSVTTAQLIKCAVRYVVIAVSSVLMD